MGLADFSRIDIVVGSQGGGERWIMVAGGGWPVDAEARLIAEFLIKVACHQRGAAEQRGAVQIELVSTEEPPICVVEIARREGIAARVGIEAPAPARGRPTAFPLTATGLPDLAALMGANARECAAALGLDDPPALAALGRLDDHLEAARAAAGLDGDETSDDALDGDLLVLAGAYAGEAIRAEVGGAWVYDPAPTRMQPIFLATGPDAGIRANVLGKVSKFLTAGPDDSVAALAQAVVRIAREQAAKG